MPPIRRAVADASNTGHIYLDSSNPNLQFLAASGHHYAASALSDEPVSAVPAPAALPLLATGCLSLLVYGWRRRQVEGLLRVRGRHSTDG